MSKCILHIGIHKTGSSSIQDSLNGFDDDRFLYLRLRHPNHSAEFGRLFGFGPKYEGSIEYNTNTINLINESIDSLSGRTLIVSGEDLSAFNPLQVGKLANFLRSSFSEISVVSYVRPPASYITSSFQQRVKSYQVGSKDKTPIIAYRKLRPIFDTYDNEFGRENVFVYKFNPTTFPNRCVATHFSQKIGLDLSKNKIVRSNESICRLTAQFLFCYHQHFPRAKYELKLDAIFKLIDDTNFTVAPSLRKLIVENNIDDLIWMEDRLGESLRESFGDDSPYDFVDASQLLHPSPEHVDALRILTNGRVEAELRDGSSKEIALMVRELLKMYDPLAPSIPDIWAELCRDVALKIESGSQLGLSDALNLMRIAKEIRPGGPLISRKVVEWEKSLSQNKK